MIDQALIKAIQDHVKVITLKQIFGLNSFATEKDNQKEKDLYQIFSVFRSTTPKIIDVNINIIEANKTYEITIKKEKLENINQKRFFKSINNYIFI